MKSVEELKLIVNQAILNAEAGKSKLSKEIIDFPGMTSPKMKHFLNNVCSHDDMRYLEIGLATGSTHFSALYGNEHLVSFGSDLWLEQKNGLDGQARFLENYEKFLGPMRTKLSTGDCFKINQKEFFNDQKIDVYFYDGGHEVDHHRDALIHFLPILEKNSIFLIDDWNDNRVQKGTAIAFNQNHCKIHHARVCKATVNSTPPHWGDMNEWWNGLAAFVIERTT